MKCWKVAFRSCRSDRNRKVPNDHLPTLRESMLNAWHGLGNDGPDLTNGETPTCLPPSRKDGTQRRAILAVWN